MTKHTPTPWEVADEISDWDLQVKQLEDRIGSRHEWTAIHDVHQNGPEIVAICHHSNAAFIVRAVNAHDALVEALGKMIVMAMHAPLDAGHGMDQSHIDEASHVLWNVKGAP